MDRLPPSMDLSYKQIWALFRDIYTKTGLTEHELRQIHQRWVDARAYAEGGPR